MKREEFAKKWSLEELRTVTPLSGYGKEDCLSDLNEVIKYELSLPPAEGAEAILKEGLDDGRYADITDGINIDVKQPFYQAIIRYAEDVVAARQQPTAEGAEENIIYHNLTQPFRQILQSVALHGYDIVFAERDCVKCATEFATLHAQRIAEKMVEEKLKKEYERGIEDGKIIGKHGSVSYIE